MPTTDDLRAEIDRLTRERDAERERCAKIAERIAEANLVNDEPTTGSSVAQSIANMIRAQSR